MQTIIETFKKYLEAVGYSKAVQKQLPSEVMEFIEQQKITDIRCVEQEKIQLFYEYLQTRPLKRGNGALSAGMIYHYVYMLKTFFSWLETTNQIDYNPVSGLKFKRPVIKAREPLTMEEIEQLFAVAQTQKEKAILHLFYSCGLRRNEGASLNQRDVDFKHKLLYVRKGKGAKRRVVPLAAQVAKDLENYYRNIRGAGIIENVSFLVSEQGSRMSGDGCYRLLKQLQVKAGITREVTLHHLRHSIATHLLQSGMGMEYVRDFLGHNYLETTQVYAKVNRHQIRCL